MTRKQIFSLGFVCILALCLGLVACGDDDDDGSAGKAGSAAGSGGTGTGGTGTAGTGTGGTGTGGTGTGGTGTGGTAAGTGGEPGADAGVDAGDAGEELPCEPGPTSGTATMTGLVVDYGTDPKEGEPDVTVEVLDNCTGEKLGISVVSGSDGTFELTGLPGTADDPVPVGILAVGVLDDQGAAVRIDTYTFNVKSNEQDRDIYSIPETMATLIPDQLGVTQADDKGSVTGAVYYIASDGNPYPLDCVVGRVEDDPTAEVYYSETSLFDKALTETSANGRFVALNIEPGYVTISALIDGEVVGSVSLPVVASGDSTGGAGTSNISRIILMPADGADPTPDCGQ